MRDAKTLNGISENLARIDEKEFSSAEDYLMAIKAALATDTPIHCVLSNLYYWMSYRAAYNGIDGWPRLHDGTLIEIGTEVVYNCLPMKVRGITYSKDKFRSSWKVDLEYTIMVDTDDDGIGAFEDDLLPCTKEYKGRFIKKNVKADSKEGKQQ